VYHACLAPLVLELIPACRCVLHLLVTTTGGLPEN
jgi:hypothetical protein